MGKDREKECVSELAAAIERLPLSDAQAWSQLPDGNSAKREVDPSDFARISELVSKRFPKASVEMGLPTSSCMVSVAPWTASTESASQDSELAALDKFEPGFADLFREARRVNGLVRKQWYLACVWVKAPELANSIPFPLGWGFSTDWNLSKVRAVHAAEIRVPILTEAML